MKFSIPNRFTGSVMFEREADSFVAFVEGLIKEKANLQDADLRGADLRGADLQDADLWGADLQDADLQGANLRGADLQGADLRDADLRGADLQDADLRGANLRGADLQDADLRDADLRGADLRGADLQDLLRSNSVHTLLTTIDWGRLPDDLTLEMMRHDAESCGTEAMTKWAKSDTNNCPFENSVRDYLFKENKALWKPGKPKYRGMELLKKLCETKGYKLEKYSEEQIKKTYACRDSNVIKLISQNRDRGVPNLKGGTSWRND